MRERWRVTTSGKDSILVAARRQPCRPADGNERFVSIGKGEFIRSPGLSSGLHLPKSSSRTATGQSVDIFKIEIEAQTGFRPVRASHASDFARWKMCSIAIGQNVVVVRLFVQGQVWLVGRA